MYTSISMIPGTDCNFQCCYCFENEKPRTFVHQKMTQDTAVAAAEYICKVHSMHNSIWLTAFGGEPLLYTDVLETIFDRITLDGVNLDIISNGFLVADKADWLLERKSKANSIIDVGVSYDYSLQDENRHAGSYDIIRNNMIWLYRNGLLGLCVTTFRCCDLNKIYEVFQDFMRLRKAIPRLQLRFNIDFISDAASYDEDAFISGLSKIREYLVRTDNFGLVLPNRASKGRSASTCVCDGVHSSINTAGDLYPMYNVIAMPDKLREMLYLGNINDDFDVLKKKHAAFYNKVNIALPEQCVNCSALCRVNPWTTIRTSLSESNGMPSELHCHIYKILSQYLLP